MPDPAELLAAYDAELRTDAEIAAAIAVEHLGPLLLTTFAGGRGLVTYRDLGTADAEQIATLVSVALAHFRADPHVSALEWKTRGHDRAPGLHESLLASGFEPDEQESIMIGEAHLLDVAVPMPSGVELRRITAPHDVRSMTTMQGDVFGDPPSKDAVEDLLRRVQQRDSIQLWVALAGGEVVCAGRLEPVTSSRFAGIWGGATLPQWRGRGIYRALTAARARAALALGRTLINCDSTEHSRPILERSGLVKVSTTTPYRRQC